MFERAASEVADSTALDHQAAEEMRLALKGRGVLRVRLLRGEGLAAIDASTKDGEKDASDPYCKLIFDGEEEQSTTIRGTVNPDWDELFNFRGTAAHQHHHSYHHHHHDQHLHQEGSGQQGAQARPTMRDLISTQLRLELYHENRMMGLNMLARNKNIGSATVDLSPLLNSHEAPLCVPLSTQGVISLVASWEVEQQGVRVPS